MATFPDVPWIEDGEIERRAREFLARTNPSDKIPVPIEEIVENQGIDIVPVRNLQRDYGIDGWASPEENAIFVNEWRSMCVMNRYRFTLAHEMGHLELHAKAFRQIRLSLKTVSDWVAFLDDLPEKLRSRMEWQAYAFAGIVLVPEKQLREEFHRCLPEIHDLLKMSEEEHIQRGHALKFAWDEMARRIAVPFQVSKNVVLKRLEFASFSLTDI